MDIAHKVIVRPNDMVNVLGGNGKVDRFDQMAVFQNFIIMPLSFLSGVFYSIHSLPPFWQSVSHLNPFFYMIDGFRYGFFGQADISPWISLFIVTTAFLLLAWSTLKMLKSGYKLRA
jgi:ABC-2 type transport system permease protein